MSHYVNIENHGAGVVVTLFGIVTGKELTQINQHIYDADSGKNLRYQIWDFTNVDILETKTSDIEKLVLQDMEEANSNSNQSVALIGAAKTLNGIDSIYHYISDSCIKNGFPSKTFSNMDDARNWIASSPSEIINKLN